MPQAPRHLGIADMYLIAGGLLVGVLLGPAVLGRVAPAAYAGLFGGAEVSRQMAAQDANGLAAIEALIATGVSAEAVEEEMQRRQREAALAAGGRDAVMDGRAMRWVALLALGLVVATGVEAAVAPRGAWLRWVRGGLLALVAAVLVARPTVLF
ncbi:MAG: hypothetical protein AAF800_01660 [Planctomycetota bacterium]